MTSRSDASAFHVERSLMFRAGLPINSNEERLAHEARVHEARERLRKFVSESDSCVPIDSTLNSD